MFEYFSLTNGRHQHHGPIPSHSISGLGGAVVFVFGVQDGPAREMGCIMAFIDRCVFVQGRFEYQALTNTRGLCDHG